MTAVSPQAWAAQTGPYFGGSADVTCPRRWSPPSTSSTGLRRGQGRPGLRRGARAAAPHLLRAAQHPHRGAAVRRARRRRADLAQARGPQPHRLAQDQQRARAGAADPADGQDPGDRRDRGRPARRGHGHRGRPVRPRVHRLHGRGGHPAAGAQRGPDGAARRRGDPRQDRIAHPQGRDQRGDARLGHQRRDHPLPVRHRRRAAPVPEHGARLPEDHRRGGPRAGARPGRAAARRGGGLRRRRLERDRHLRRVPRRPAGRACSGSRPAATGCPPGGTPPRSPAARPACCTAAAPSSCRTRTARPSRSHSISAGLDYPGVGPEHAWLAETGRASTSRSTDAEAMEAFRLLCRTEGIIPAIESAHALAGAIRAGRRAGPGRGDPGQPVRPRRQGRGDRSPLLRGGPDDPGQRGGDRRRPGRGPRRADRLPAGRLPGPGHLDRRGTGRGRRRARTSSSSDRPTPTR